MNHRISTPIFPAALVAALGVLLACGGVQPPAPTPQEPVPSEEQPLLSACDANPCTAPGRTVCVGDSQQYFCLCEPGLLLDGEGCVAERTPLCGFEHGGDALEPDDCVEQARPVPEGGLQAQPRTLGEGAGDVDWLRLSANEGDSWRIDLAASPGLPLAVEVLEADAMTPVAARQWVGNGGLAFVAPESADYYVRIRSASLSARGAYALTVQNDGEDGHGGSVDTTGTVGVGQPAAGRLQFAGDDDAVWLEVPARRHLEVQLAWEDGQTVPLTLLALDADATVRAQARGAPAKLRLYSAKPQSVVLVARDGTGIATGAWRMSVVDLGADDHGDTRESATPVEGEKASGQGTFERPDDGDAFLFTPPSSGIYRFGCTTSDVQDACGLRVYDPDGKDLSGSSGAQGEVRVEVSGGGSYLIRVSPQVPATSYAWSFERVGADDHGDAPANATSLSGPVQLGGQFEVPWDRDVFSLYVAPDEMVELSCTSLAPGGCELVLLDAGGQPVALLSSGVNLLSGRDLSLWYLEVAASGGAVGAYTLSVKDAGKDDHGNRPGSATRLRGVGGDTGTFESLNDADWYVFPVERAQRARFHCADVTPCFVRLVDAAGRTVASGEGSASVLVAEDGPLYVELTTEVRQADVRYKWQLSVVTAP